MICKAAEYENGYIFGPGWTTKEFQNICRKYDKIKCVICNYKTAQIFTTVGGSSYITINNKIADGCFFINRIK